MPSPLQRVANLLGLRRDGATKGPPPPDRRTLPQVLIGTALGGLIAGLLWALLGGDAASSVGFGVIMGVVFLWMDLRYRRRASEPPQVDGPDGGR